MGIVTINGRDIRSFGATLLEGAYGELLKPANLKALASNDDPNKDGVEYITPKTTPKLEEATRNIVFLVQGDTPEQFIANYEAFLLYVQSPVIDLYVERLARHYFFKFDSCTTFENFALKACKIAIRFTEPNPRKRA